MEQTETTRKEFGYSNDASYGNESIQEKEFSVSPVVDHRLVINDNAGILSDARSFNRRDFEQRRANEECAQENLIKTMESRKSRTRTQSGDFWLSAVEGERPPLGGRVPFEKLYEKVVDLEGSFSSIPSPRTYNSILRRPPPISKRSATTDCTSTEHLRVKNDDMKQRMLGLMNTGKNAQFGPIPSESPVARRHRRTTSRAKIVLDSIQEKTHGLPASDDLSSANLSAKSRAELSVRDGIHPNEDISRPIRHRSCSVGMSEADELLAHALVDNNQQAKDDEQSHAPPPPPPPDLEEAKKEAEDDFLICSQRSDFYSTHADEAISESFPLLKLEKNISEASPGSFDTRESYKVFDNNSSKLTASLHRTRLHNKSKSRRLKRFLSQCCNPSFFVSQINGVIRGSFFTRATIPLCITSIILFYFLGNPSFYFLPGEATLAWWLNFFGRQCVTLELARFIQFIVVDCIMLRTRSAVPFLGPFITLCCIQSRGWPFIVSTWGVLDLFLLHGNDKFQLHWFYFTKIDYFMHVNSGNYILASGLYLRILLSVLIAGLACTIKRSLLAVMFGRRTFSMFKPRLESILKEVVILSEVAELAAEANRLGAPDIEEPYAISSSLKINIPFADLTWACDRRTEPIGTGDDLTVSSDSLDDKLLDDLENKATQCLENSSRKQHVKDLLEKWEEPIGKSYKSLNTSIRDILKFRRALTFLDDLVPFGEAFGAASSRDQVLDSAEIVYRRLLKMCPDRCNLACEVFDILMDLDDGKILCDAKKKSLKKLFRPDANREISAVAFLQGCDGLYKKLCFFRASVGNTSVIDEALEEIINGFFYFVLMLVILSILKVNPWPLLVSASTLLVSFSFAVGSSASKYIEGVILIAVRRPYDLGDRIYMLDPSNVKGDGIGMSWYIEDINLSYTTIRYASTNEVATLSNGSIANLRIINANRSPNAIVNFQLPVHVSIVSEKKEKLALFGSALDRYVRENPNHWKCFMYCRVSELHVELEQAILGIGLQHQCSWQDLGRILQAKADLLCYVFELSRSLEVNYEGIPDRGIMYYGGQIKNEGDCDNYRVNLTNAKNIQVPNGLESRSNNPLLAWTTTGR